MTGPETILGVKYATLIASFIGAVISITVDLRHHSAMTVVGSLLAGVFIAAIATAATIEFFELSATWGYAVAGFYGISGRNWVIWISRASKDPAGIIAALLKGRK